MGFELTKDRINRAYAEGARQATREIQRGYDTELENIWSKKDRADTVYSLAGEKLAHDSYEADELIDSYEDGYYTIWEDHNA